MANEYKPGDTVEKSGIYTVVHDTTHAGTHEVTCVFGKRFPPCGGCGKGVRFTLRSAAQHIEHNEHFK